MRQCIVLIVVFQACVSVARATPTFYTLETVIPNNETHLVAIDDLASGIVRRFPAQPNYSVSALAYDPSTNDFYAFAEFTDSSDELLRVDRHTGEFSKIADTESPLGGIRGFAVQPSTYDLYGLSWDGELVRIDKTTGQFDIVNISRFHYYQTLAFSPDGRLFAVDTGLRQSQLYQLNPKTGEAMSLGTIDRNYIVGLAFDANGNLYGVDNGTNALVSIDLATRKATTLLTFGAGLLDHNSLAIVVPEPATWKLAACLLAIPAASRANRLFRQRGHVF